MEKFILKSKTIIAGLVSVLIVFLPLLGYHVGPDETAFINQGADAFIVLLGWLGIVYGRVKAKDDVTLFPKRE